LTRLVEDLRTLALADAGQLALECTSTDIVGLVRRVVERFNPTASARQVSLRLDFPEAALHPSARSAARRANPGATCCRMLYGTRQTAVRSSLVGGNPGRGDPGGA